MLSKLEEQQSTIKQFMHHIEKRLLNQSLKIVLDLVFNLSFGKRV